MAFRRYESFLRAPLFAALLLLIAAVVMSGCVSVQKSGNQDTPSPQGLAAVSFDSTASRAEVYVDGEFRGTAPVTLQLSAGTHAVAFKLAGFKTWSRELVVVAGDDTRVTATLQRE